MSIYNQEHQVSTAADEFTHDAEVSKHWSLGSIFHKMDWHF